jgi:hypothetical protein
LVAAALAVMTGEPLPLRFTIEDVTGLIGGASRWK